MAKSKAKGKSAKRGAKSAAKPKSKKKSSTKPAAKSKAKSATKSANKPKPAAQAVKASKPSKPAKISYVPEGYYSVTPYLFHDQCAAAIEFYKKALRAKEIARMPGPNGTIGHAEIQIGDSRIMMADAPHDPRHGQPPRRLGGTSCGFCVYVPDVDALHAHAVAAGAHEVAAPEDKFYGDRMSQITDPFGHIWYLATHVKDVSMEEMMAAVQAMSAQMEGQSSGQTAQPDLPLEVEPQG